MEKTEEIEQTKEIEGTADAPEGIVMVAVHAEEDNYLIGVETEDGVPVGFARYAIGMFPPEEHERMFQSRELSFLLPLVLRIKVSENQSVEILETRSLFPVIWKSKKVGKDDIWAQRERERHRQINLSYGIVDPEESIPADQGPAPVLPSETIED